jgi:hypothetical protein
VLGRNAQRNVDGSFEISMPSLREDCLYGITGTRTTPAAPDLFEIDHDSPLLSDNEQKRFHTITCKLLYYVDHIQHEMKFAVSFLTTRMLHPTIQDAKKLKHLLEYLNAQRLSKHISTDGPLDVHADIDASYALHDDGKGHSGVAVFVGDCPVLTVSKKQHLVTTSSTTAELVALSKFAQKAVNVQAFMTAQGYSDNVPIVYQDNKSCIAMIQPKGKPLENKNLRQHQMNVKQLIGDKEIRVDYKPTEDMVADVLTKELQGPTFVKMRALMLGKKSLGGALDILGKRRFEEDDVIII